MTPDIPFIYTVLPTAIVGTYRNSGAQAVSSSILGKQDQKASSLMRQSLRQRHTVEMYGTHEALDDLLVQVEADFIRHVESKRAVASLKDKIALIRRNLLLLAAHGLPTRGSA